MIAFGPDLFLDQPGENIVFPVPVIPSKDQPGENIEFPVPVIPSKYRTSDSGNIINRLLLIMQGPDLGNNVKTFLFHFVLSSRRIIRVALHFCVMLILEMRHHTGSSNPFVIVLTALY